MKFDQVKISHARPPLADECERKFGVDWNKGMAIAYKDTIFITPGFPLTDDFLVHEATHLKGKEEEWWKRYFQDEDFRLDQELIAYRRQYERYCQIWKDGNKRIKMLKYFLDCLQKMYGFSRFDRAEALKIVSGK